MDKIEFFPIDAGSRGGGSKGQRGSRCGEDEGGGSKGQQGAATRAGAAREAEREAGKAAGIAKGGGNGRDGDGRDGDGSRTGTGVGRGLADYQHVPV